MSPLQGREWMGGAPYVGASPYAMVFAPVGGIYALKGQSILA